MTKTKDKHLCTYCNKHPEILKDTLTQSDIVADFQIKDPKIHLPAEIANIEDTQFSIYNPTANQSSVKVEGHAGAIFEMC